jgi:DNA-binding protein Fis
MSPNPVGKSNLRITIDTADITLLRRLSGVTERSISSLVSDALQDYFAREDIQQLIDLYNLEAEVTDPSDESSPS